MVVNIAAICTCIFFKTRQWSYEKWIILKNRGYRVWGIQVYNLESHTFDSCKKNAS